jgi:hypothetical protein
MRNKGIFRAYTHLDLSFSTGVIKVDKDRHLFRKKGKDFIHGVILGLKRRLSTDRSDVRGKSLD